MNVLLVCSSGGHLAQLARLRPWWQQHERRWVTFPTADSKSVLADEQVSWAAYPTTRNLPNMMRNLWLAINILRNKHPDLVVTTGAAVAFPFFLAARWAGIPTVYIEVYDRIDSATLTGRLCYPLTDLFLLQWDEQKRFYPAGRVIGRLL